MELETLRIERDGPLAHLVLDLPDRLNALGAAIMGELVEAARWLDSQLDIRLVILRGEGRAFSAGADLRDVSTADAASGEWQRRREVGQRGLRVVNAIEQMRAITIAQVHGYAVGGGLLLMCACDLRVAAEDTQFFIPEVALGIPLAWGGIPRLVREIGPAMTKELVMTCRRFGAAEAKALGMVNRVVPEEQLSQEVAALAAGLLEMPAGPLVITKDHVNAVSQSIGAGLTAHADGDVLLGSLADPAGREARQRYVEKTFKKE